jgi:uncharacterized protein YndB with AHSA1/START domain
MNTEPFVIERTYEAPVNAVWQALTNVDKMRQWYFDVDDFKPEVGFTFHFWGEDKGVRFEHECIVTDAIYESKIAYSWRYTDYPGNSLVSIELFDEGRETRVRLTHTGIETFAVINNASFGRESFAAGWTYILGTGLKDYLEKQSH